MKARKTATRRLRAPSLPAAALHRAEQLCTKAGERLTPARINAYAELLTQKNPISAYELLALMEQREGRKLAPLTVYRQLDFLVRVGLVHKLTSAQAYVACEHPDHPHDTLYLVCSSCGKADELESERVAELLSKAARSRGFKPGKAIVEVPGLCQTCRQPPDGADGIGVAGAR
ncbi:MAG: Fur family transcriptional regulator [Sinimarinibacterium flocculans]|uniref:Fur family zinc uptake transcriptional regulator n=1 Tax=Sinimarinibacterium flocculans TaxID=985250 RepID=A0A318ECH9_9GAMM|nr:Fur family transcriptional regulator [Sinimarinibacterium flocculans]PXV65324.1 Fur family zinc uptake transcriptional regulator [Sinimarinibacterium flocculans]